MFEAVIHYRNYPKPSAPVVRFENLLADPPCRSNHMRIHPTGMHECYLFLCCTLTPETLTTMQESFTYKVQKYTNLVLSLDPPHTQIESPHVSCWVPNCDNTGKRSQETQHQYFKPFCLPLSKCLHTHRILLTQRSKVHNASAESQTAETAEIEG